MLSPEFKTFKTFKAYDFRIITHTLNAPIDSTDVVVVLNGEEEEPDDAGWTVLYAKRGGSRAEFPEYGIFQNRSCRMR